MGKRRGEEGDGDGNRNSSKRKNKGRMSYLKQRGGRGGRGGRDGSSGGWGGGGGGDYVSAYGPDGQKKRQRQYIEPGMKGFFLTTNFRERECVREAYNLLNEYYRPEDDEQDAESGTSQPSQGEKKALESQSLESQSQSQAASASSPKEKEDDEDLDDIDKALENEVKELKSAKSYKFESIDTGVPNVVFIKTNVKRHSDIVYRIFEDAVATKECKCRNILRFIPIEGICHGDELRVRSKEIMTPYFKDGYKSFKIVINTRYTTISKDSIIKTVAEVVTEINPLNVVNLTEPALVVYVEVMKSLIFISVLKNFALYRKFNIIEIVSPTPVPSSEKPKPDSASEVKPKVEAEENVIVAEKTESVPASEVKPKVEAEENVIVTEKTESVPAEDSVKTNDSAQAE